MSLNLLTEPLIRFHISGKRTMASLPNVFATLMDDNVIAFPALRPHQRHAWHAFLVQVGALAMSRVRLDTPPTRAAEWACLIRGLTPDFPYDEPWHLVVEDSTVPAFMQPPAGSIARMRSYRTTVKTPDDLDILVTSRNHDLKSTVAIRAGVDDWLFALITLQTMGGYGGYGNYGISRMNGGLGNRPAFSLAPASGGTGAHVRRDILALLEHRQMQLSGGLLPDCGSALLWTLPWDGGRDEALNIAQLDPLYIEICRAVRLRLDSRGGLQGGKATTESARLDIKNLKGRTGDPWTPVSTTRDGLPLTLGPGGFTYGRVADCLTSSDWELPLLCRPTRAERDSQRMLRLVARATVRGQGRTEGHHERSIIIGHGLKTVLYQPGMAEELGETARSRIEQVGRVQQILGHAIEVLAARGDEERISPENRHLGRPWLKRLDELVDTHFFECLQDEFEAEESQRQIFRKRWLMNGSDGVIDHARALLRDATDTLPTPVMLRYRARVRAEALFERRLRVTNGLPFLFSEVGRGGTMTIEQIVERTDVPDTRDRSSSWADVAVRFAYRMASAHFPRGDLANLRRMRPDRPGPAVYWRLMGQEELLGSPILEVKWALILHGIALMTSTVPGDSASRNAHDGYIPVGRALFLGKDTQRSTAFYSDTRLLRLLTARGSSLHSLLARMFRIAASSGVRFNWREMARFILREGCDNEAVEWSRRRIAREYYQAERQSSLAIN